MIDSWFRWWRRPAAEAPRPAAGGEAESGLVRVSEIRRGDRFAEVFRGQTQAYLALEDAYPHRSATQPPGHQFKALGDRGPQVFYCATGWETYGPQLYRVPPEEVPDERAEGCRCRPRRPCGARPPAGDREWAEAPCLTDAANLAAERAPQIVIIAQNPVWVVGLVSVCQELGTVAGWTAREWLVHVTAHGLGVAPQLVIHHRGDVPPGETDFHPLIGRGLRRGWPGLKWVTITDDARAGEPEAGLCLPQACGEETLRHAVRALLAGTTGSRPAGP